MEKLIKLSDAMDAVMWGNGLDGSVVDDICEKLEALPSADIDLSEYSDKLWRNAYERGKADRPQGWIPCTEREPNEFEDVLVLLSDGTMDVLQLTDYLDIWGNVKWCHVANHGMGYAVSGNEVVAWMPLPKPWEGADNE